MQDLLFQQPVDGYRAPVDGVLVARFAGPPRKLAVDLGAGAGVVSLTVLAHAPAAQLLSIDRDETMLGYLRRNLEANGWGARATLVAGDVEEIAASRRGCADLVLANPPYWKDGASSPSRHPRAQTARSAPAHGALPVFMRAARVLMGHRARACFVWPANDTTWLFEIAHANGLHPKRIRWFHPRLDRPAARALVELRPGRLGGLVVEPPLVQSNDRGEITAEFAQWTYGTTPRH